MNEAANVEPIPVRGHYFGPGEVLGGLLDGFLPVRLTADGGSQESWAQPAISDPIGPGDEVLVAGQAGDRLFIIGVLAGAEQPSASEIRTDTGACARVEGKEGEQCLRVFSPGNTLLFEYNPAADRATVVRATGDLEFETPDGGMCFRSGGDIRFEARDIDLAARSRIRLAVTGELRRLGSTLRLGMGRLSAASERVEVDAGRARLHVDETRFVGRRLLGKLAYVQLVADKCETVANTLVEKSRNAYRTVEQLAQLRTGRLRTLVEATYQVTAGKAFLKSREDFKVKADKIHLG